MSKRFRGEDKSSNESSLEENKRELIFAIEQQNLNKVDELLRRAPRWQLSDIIEDNDIDLFNKALESESKKNSGMLKMISAILPEEMQKFLSDKFNHALIYDDLELTEMLLTVASQEQREKIIEYLIEYIAEGYECNFIIKSKAIFKAASQQQLQRMIEVRDFWLLKYTANNCEDFEIIEMMLAAVTGEQITRKISLIEPLQGSNYINVNFLDAIFSNVVEHNKIEVVNMFFERFSKGQQKNMIESNKFMVFQFALKNSNPEVFNMLFNTASEDQRRAMLEVNANRFKLMWGAVLWNKIEIFKIIFENSTPEQLRQIALHDSFKGYYYRNIEVFKMFFQVASEAQRQAMLAFDNFKIFNITAERGNIKEFEMLFASAPEIMQQEILAFDNFKVLRSSALGNNPKMLEMLFKLTTHEQQQEMVRYNSYEVFRYAINAGKIELFKMLSDVFSEEELHSILHTFQMPIVFNVVRNKDLEMFAVLLEKSDTHGRRAIVRHVTQHREFLAEDQLVQIPTEIKNIATDLEQLARMPDDAEYTRSKDSFVLQLMKEVYVLARQKILEKNQSPALSESQTAIVESVTRKLGSYIYLNRKKILEVKNQANTLLGPDNVGLPADEKRGSMIFPEEIWLNIFSSLLPTFDSSFKDKDLRGNPDLLEAKNAANHILHKHEVTTASIVSSTINRAQARRMATAAATAQPPQASSLEHPTAAGVLPHSKGARME